MSQVGFRKPYRGPYLQAFSLAELVVPGSVEGLLRTGWVLYDLIKDSHKSQKEQWETREVYH